MNLPFLNVLILSTVFLIPLLGAVKSFGFEQTKILFFMLSITLMGFVWMGKGIRWTLIGKTAGIFILILLITTVIGINPRNSLLGREPYFQGWALYSYLFLFYLMVKTFKIKQVCCSATALEKYALVLSIAAFFVSFLAIRDWVFLNILNIPVLTYANRVVSTFGQPNFYAGFLLLTLPFAYFLLKNPNRRLQYLGWGSGLISMIGILVSYSRLAILLALCLLILGLIGELKVKLKLGLAVISILLVSAVIAWRFSSGLVGNEIAEPLVTNNPDLTKESVEKRAYVWPQSFKIFLQKPLAGYGLENIGLAFSNYFERNKHLLFEENLNISPVLISLKELNIDRSHNYLLDLLLFSGVFGLLSWMFLVSLLFVKVGQIYHGRDINVLAVGLATYLIWIQFQNQSIVQLIYFWLLVGLIDQGS